MVNSVRRRNCSLPLAGAKSDVPIASGNPLLLRKVYDQYETLALPAFSMKVGSANQEAANILAVDLHRSGCAVSTSRRSRSGFGPHHTYPIARMLSSVCVTSPDMPASRPSLP